MKKIDIMVPNISKKEEKAAVEVLRSGWLVQGKKVAEFEKLVAAEENASFGVATTSCTTALHLSLAVLGIKEGMDVIVPSFTFVATPNSVLYVGATPVLSDIDERTYNMTGKTLQYTIDNIYIKKDKKLTNKDTGNELKAVIAVNLFGQCAELDKIKKITDNYGLYLIEDSACALGAEINGKREGRFGIMSCLSFHPRKSITTGEGGMILTDDEKLAEELRKYRSHGASLSEANRHLNKGYLLPEYNFLGYNYRMTDIQAAVGIEQIKRFKEINDIREKLARNYDKMLNEVNFLKKPYVEKGYTHRYQSYVCMLDIDELKIKTIKEGNVFRNKLMDYLYDEGIATRVGTHATHMLGLYKNKYKYKKEDFPNSYMCDALGITLPLHHLLSKEEQKYIIRKIIDGKNKILGDVNEKHKR